MLSIGKRPMRLPMKIIGNVMAIGIALAGCGTYAEFQFVDWTRLEGFDQSMNEAAISDLLLRDDIELICQLSPYTSSLNPEDRGLESALKEEDLLGVNGTREGYYMFAYFSENEELLGFKYIKIHRGMLRAKLMHKVTYVCVSSTDGKLAVSKSEDFITFGLKQAKN